MQDDNEIEKYHLILNDFDFIDGKYYRRNMFAYEYVSYINHIIACYYSKNYHVMTTFLRRAKKYAKNNGKKYISPEYLKITKEYLESVQSFLIELGDEEQIRRINGF